MDKQDEMLELLRRILECNSEQERYLKQIAESTKYAADRLKAGQEGMRRLQETNPLTKRIVP